MRVGTSGCGRSIGSDRRRCHLRSATARLAALDCVARTICVTLILLTHPWVISPVQAWASSGWSGPRANDIQAVDYIAGRVRSHRGKQGRPWISNIFPSLMPAMNIVSPRYKVGAELDLYLEHRYGISNSDRCAEGISAVDEYRIVQQPPKLAKSDEIPPSWLPLGGEVKQPDLDQYFDIPLDPSFHAAPAVRRVPGISAYFAVTGRGLRDLPGPGELLRPRPAWPMAFWRPAAPWAWRSSWRLSIAAGPDSGHMSAR